MTQTILFDLFDPQYIADPHAFYARLRKTAPVQCAASAERKTSLQFPVEVTLDMVSWVEMNIRADGRRFVGPCESVRHGGGGRC